MFKKTTYAFVSFGLLALVACGGDDPGNTTPAPQDCTGEPDQVLDQGVVNTDTTLEGCVQVEQYVGITEGAKITVQPGTTLQFADGAGFKTQEAGALHAAGTQSEPILMTGSQATSGFWSGLYFENTTNPDNVLEYVTIEHAGKENDGSVVLDGEEGRISVENVTIRDGKTSGFVIHTFNQATIESFEDNTITGHATPMSVRADALTAITSSNSLTGNADDRVEVTDWLLSSDTTFHDIGVPLLITEGVGLPANAPVRLTIEPGVELVMSQKTDITAQEDCVLNARGTADNPIIIRGKEQLAGYWTKIRFEESRSADNVLEHVEISDAGATEEVAVQVGGVTDGSQVVLNDVSFENIDGTAIHANEYSEILGCNNMSFNSVSGDDYNRTDACQ